MLNPSIRAQRSTAELSPPQPGQWVFLGSAVSAHTDLLPDVCQSPGSGLVRSFRGNGRVEKELGKK